MAGKSWQSAWVEVLPDLSNFRRNANSEMTSVLGSAGTTGGLVAGRNMGDGLLSGIRGLAAPILGAIAALGIGRLVGQAIGAGISYGLDSINLASSLGEQVNAVQVAFGDVADEILDLSKDAPKSLNLTRVAFDQLAVRFSAFAKNIAGPGGNVAAVIDQLTSRGSDFASVFDIEASEALELFQSGLAGETEPLRRFGLDLSAARVELFAYEHGIAAVGDELTEAQKIQARYGSLLEQTAQVQGDLANTAGSYANQQRQFAVALEESQTALGEALLPAATDILAWANTDFIPILSTVLAEVGPDLAEALRDAQPQIEAALTQAAQLAPGAITAIVDQISKAITDGANTATFFNDPLSLFEFEEFNGETDGIRPQVEDLFSWIEQRFAQYKSNLEAVGIDTYTDKQAEAWADYGDRLAAVLAGSENDFSDYNNAIQAGLKASADGAYLIGLEIPRGFARGVIEKKGEALRAVAQMADEVVTIAQTRLQIASPSKVFEQIGAYTVEGFNQGINGTPVASIDLPRVSGSGASGFGAGFPDTITLVDADGSILTRAKVIADTAVGQYAYQSDAALVGRTQ